MPLPQELQEKELLESRETLPNKWQRKIGPIKREIAHNNNFSLNELYNSFPHAPQDLDYTQIVDRYIDHFKDFGILQNMQCWSADTYMQREHQKTYAKAYFVPLLQKIFNFCDEQGHTDMAQAMAYNIKDETGEWPTSKLGNIYESDKYVSPEVNEGEEYKKESHAKRREYEYNGLVREYNKLKISQKQFPPRNIGMQIFNMITAQLLQDTDEANQYECIGAAMFLEKLIPYEFTYMQKARDRLFPELTKQERHYIDDHIIHDIEFHYQDILKGINNMNMNPQQKQSITRGMHKIYTGRLAMYSAFSQQIEPSNLHKIIHLPVVQKMKYGVAASIALFIAMQIYFQNHKSTKSKQEDYITRLYDIDNIKSYEKKVAEQHGVRTEYSSGKSTNFMLMDFIGYEALRQAIREQKDVDIGNYMP